MSSFPKGCFTTKTKLFLRFQSHIFCYCSSTLTIHFNQVENKGFSLNNFLFSPFSYPLRFFMLYLYVEKIYSLSPFYLHKFSLENKTLVHIISVSLLKMLILLFIYAWNDFKSLVCLYLVLSSSSSQLDVIHAIMTFVIEFFSLLKRDFFFLILCFFSTIFSYPLLKLNHF